MVNKVQLIGNLGQDPEVRRLENGKMVARLNVATNETYKDRAGEWQTQTEWHIVIIWNQLAEAVEKHLKKGSLIYLEGKLTHRKYTDGHGVERYTAEVVANTFRQLDKKPRQTRPEDDPEYWEKLKQESDAKINELVQQATTTGGEQHLNGDGFIPSSQPEDDDLPF